MCGLIAGHTEFTLIGIATPYQVQRQPMGCSAGEPMVPSQGTSATGSRVLLADKSLAGWIPLWGL